MTTDSRNTPIAREWPCSACDCVGGNPHCQLCDRRPYAEYTGPRTGRGPMYDPGRPDIDGSAAGCSSGYSPPRGR